MIAKIEIPNQLNKLHNEDILNLDDFFINPNIDMTPPVPILEYVNNNTYPSNIPIFTEDNISMIQGKAKSRKSTFVRAVAIAIAKRKYQMLSCGYKRNDIAIFDTEQGQYQCWWSAKMIKSLSGRDIFYYSISNTDSNQKKQIIEQFLKTHENCGFIIIDNIIHLLTDFNSPYESANLNQWLLTTKKEYNVHICNVLHENGSDVGNGKAKGHLGTLLENTCETIIRVEKNSDDKTKSIIMPKAMRGLEFPPLQISTDYQGTPFLEHYIEPFNTGRKTKHY